MRNPFVVGDSAGHAIENIRKVGGEVHHHYPSRASAIGCGQVRHDPLHRGPLEGVPEIQDERRGWRLIVNRVHVEQLDGATESILDLKPADILPCDRDQLASKLDPDDTQERQHRREYIF